MTSERGGKNKFLPFELFVASAIFWNESKKASAVVAVCLKDYIKIK